MSLSVEELLKPRIIVENNYPRSPFKHHEIICEPSAEQEQWAKEFPQNFRYLNWWEEREEKDMPEYVKHKTGWMAKVVKHFSSSWDEYTKYGCKISESFYSYSDVTPATETEYLNYQKANKNG